MPRTGRRAHRPPRAARQGCAPGSPPASHPETCAIKVSTPVHAGSPASSMQTVATIFHAVSIAYAYVSSGRSEAVPDDACPRDRPDTRVHRIPVYICVGLAMGADLCAARSGRRSGYRHRIRSYNPLNVTTGAAPSTPGPPRSGARRTRAGGEAARKLLDETGAALSRTILRGLPRRRSSGSGQGRGFGR